MNLWNLWYRIVRYFQPACSRSRTYMFLVLILVGFCIRSECAGVTSFIRALCLEPGLYKGFLHFFNYSTALDLTFLTQQWYRLVHRMFPVLQVGGYDVYVADGLKIAKEGKKMPVVLVIHPMLGIIILMCTDCSIELLTVIQTYRYRFKTEVGFRSAIHGIGTYAYHFWMKSMKPIRRREGKQYLHKQSDAYRKLVKRKVEAYHRFVQLGCIAQGLMQHRSVVHGKEVWTQFRSWLRTMKTNNPPSEWVVSYALRSGVIEFLVNSPPDHELKKIIVENMAVQQMQEYHMAA